jgi:hypothetical protein
MAVGAVILLPRICRHYPLCQSTWSEYYLVCNKFKLPSRKANYKFQHAPSLHLLIYLTQSLVNNCQIKSRKILILKNQYDKVCNVLKTVNEKAHLALNEEVSNKVLNDQEVAPQEFISDMLNKSKMAFMVYNIKMNKRRVLITQRRIPLLEKLKCFSGHQYLVSSQPEVRPIPTCTYINQYNDYVSKIFHFKIKIA